MKAPDKIYLQTCGECHGLECDTCRFEELGEVSWCEDRIYETDKEYIRKDAMLEWLKLAVECYSHPDTVNVVDTIRCEGKKWAFQDVINKIESL